MEIQTYGMTCTIVWGDVEKIIKKLHCGLRRPPFDEFSLNNKPHFFPLTFSFLISSNDNFFIIHIVNVMNNAYEVTFYAFLCLSKLFMLIRAFYAYQPTTNNGAFYAYQLLNAFL